MTRGVGTRPALRGAAWLAHPASRGRRTTPPTRRRPPRPLWPRAHARRAPACSAPHASRARVRAGSRGAVHTSREPRRAWRARESGELAASWRVPFDRLEHTIRDLLDAGTVRHDARVRGVAIELSALREQLAQPILRVATLEHRPPRDIRGAEPPRCLGRRHLEPDRVTFTQSLARDRIEHHAAAAREHPHAPRERLLERPTLAPAKRGLPFRVEQLRDREAGLGLDPRVEIGHGHGEPLAQALRDGRLAGAHEPDQGERTVEWSHEYVL